MSFSKLLKKSYTYILPMGFIVIISIMILTNLLAVSLMNNSSNTMVSIVKEKIYSNNLLRTMTQASFSRSMILAEMLQTDDPFRNDDLYLDLNSLATTFVTHRAKFESLDHDEKLQNLLNKQDDLSRVLGPIQHKVYELIQLDKREEATLLFRDESLMKQNEVHEMINNMSEYQFLTAQETYQDLENNNNNVLSKILIFNLFSVLISIFLTIFIIRKQKHSDKKLAHLATTDILTKLPNRASFKDNIDAQIKQKPHSTFAIIFFDIDHFKSINDNYGHEVGDKILKKYAHHLNSTISEIDVLSRFGGDEFVLLLRNIKSKEDAETFIKNLSERLDRSCVIDNNEIFITSSIGISIYSNDGSSARTLLKNADIAMYTAKEAGRNCYRFFSIETQKKMEREHEISHSLHVALKNNNKSNELSLKYQPLLSIAESEINECEALLRWDTEDGIDVSDISTDEFIAIAEKSNLIEKINLLVIDEACKQQSEWQKAGITKTRININLSGNKVIFGNLLDRFNEKITQLGLSPSLFGIELTERTILDVSEETIESLKLCRKSGMKISIDDFGTGYSSLSYLKKLPITTIKIDKSFIAGLTTDNDDCELVKTIITLGHSLKLDVVAEGVETQEQLNFLMKYKCDLAQGYLLHYPLNHKKLAALQIAA